MKAHGSAAFSTFTVFHNHHINVDPKRAPLLIKDSLFISLPLGLDQAGSAGHHGVYNKGLIHATMWMKLKNILQFHVYATIQYVAFCVWFLELGTILPWSSSTL